VRKTVAPQNYRLQSGVKLRKILEAGANVTTYTADQNSTPKPYESPRLVVYGDLRQITQSAGFNGGSDSQTSGPNRTRA